MILSRIVERVSENGEVSFWAAEQPGEYELPGPLANRSIWLAMRRTLRGLPSAGLPTSLSSEAVGNWAPSPARVPFLNNRRRSTPARQINYAVSRTQVKWVPGPQPPRCVSSPWTPLPGHVETLIVPWGPAGPARLLPDSFFLGTQRSKTRRFGV